MNRKGKEIIDGLRELADAAHKGDLSKFKQRVVRVSRKKRADLVRRAKQSGVQWEG